MTGWLVDTLIATSLLMALVLIVREPVRRRFGPRVAYALWLLPALRMVLPPLSRTVERLVPAAPPAQVSKALLSNAAPIESMAAATDWTAALLALWLAGAIVMLVFGLTQYARQRRAILLDAVQMARIGRIRLVRSEKVRGPVAFGIFDRVVIVPFDFDDRFCESQRRLALDHELAHHRSGDLVANLIAFVLLCLQWFNPLAWAAHAAFRFDQEAACDARVLDEADGRDRATYGQAIAKAASGRTLLFAGALDRPSTLSRRLKIMTYGANHNRRRIGFTLVGGAIIVALPLTATWAVNYVDVAGAASPADRFRQAAKVAPVAAAAPAAAPLAAAPLLAAAAVPAGASGKQGYVLPGGVTLDKDSVAFFDDDRVVINGRAKRLDELTPSERSKLRGAIAKSHRDLERERAELPERLAEVRRELDRIRSGAFKAELVRNREDLRRDLAEIDAIAGELRAEGENPEKRRAEIREALSELKAIDIDKEVRQALAEANPERIAAELREAEAQMARITVKLNELDRNR